MVYLFRKISNFIIEKCPKYISPPHKNWMIWTTGLVPATLAMAHYPSKLYSLGLLFLLIIFLAGTIYFIYLLEYFISVCRSHTHGKSLAHINLIGCSDEHTFCITAFIHMHILQALPATLHGDEPSSESIGVHHVVHMILTQGLNEPILLLFICYFECIT